jgi:hypothetical protein
LIQVAPEPGWFEEHAMHSSDRSPLPLSLLFKAAVGFGVATLAAFGAAAPHLGLQPNLVSESAALAAGVILGVLVAIRR